MASLENVYHDFARLAKQSGFHFQLHRGEVNWSDIENVSIAEITEKKNFHLLERNLNNVINCNLEKEYDDKIFEKNFGKLFKLAQLGVDYLFYCVMYLDNCVILLQEQLIASREKCESLTLENQKIKGESNRIKRKSETQNYRCEKCGKSFISDIYLKYHNKSRHSTLIMSERTDKSHKKGVDNWQQTEHEKKLTTSTQTLILEEMPSVPKNSEDQSGIKMPLVIKIENLVLEFQDLKERLKKVENTLSEKTEPVKSNESHSSNISGSVHSNSMLMLLPSYLLQLGNGYYEINPRCQASVPEFGQTNNTPSPNSVNSKTTENKPLTENFSQINIELKKPFEKVCNSAKEESKSDALFGSVTHYQSEENYNLEYNKENIDLIRSNSLIKLTKPLPPPRKSKKKKILSQVGKEQKPLEEPFEIIKSSINHEEQIKSFNSHSINNESTPIKEKLNGEAITEIFEESKDNLREINKSILNSSGSLDDNQSEPETEFFIKKVVTKNSPKLGRFGKHFKSSLTSFCDSVSFTEKDLNKKEFGNQNLKGTVTDKLNNHLRRLGVDPEWSGIPRKTMIQKLNALKQSRKILSKENPAFLEIRQNIEEKLFQRLKKNLEKKKAVFINKLHKQKAISTESPTTQDSQSQQKLEFVRSKSSLMFDTDTDLESKSSNSESNFNQGTKQNVLQKSIIVEDLISEYERSVGTKKDEEFDVSVFQVGGSRCLDSVTQIGSQKYVSTDKADGVSTDSDVKYNFLKNSNDISFIKPNELLSKSRDGNTDLEKKFEDNVRQFEVSHLENAKAPNLIISKQRYASQSKLTMNEKKKILFENYEIDFEEDLSDSPTDDELWSVRSEWAREAG